MPYDGAGELVTRTPLLGLPDVGLEACAVDTETSGLHADDGARVSTVIVAWRDTSGSIECRALPFDQGWGDKFATMRPGLFGEANLGEAEWLELCGWLAGRRIVMHNAKFDLHMMTVGTRAWPGVDLSECLVWDTMSAEALLEPNQGISLDAAGKRHGLGGKVGKDAVREWLKTNAPKIPNRLGRYDLAPWDVMEPYAIGDGDLTLRLYEYQLERMEAGELDVPLYYRAVEFTIALYRMERRGLGYDVEGSLDAARAARAQQEQVGEAVPFRPFTEPAAKHYFYDGGLTSVRLDEATGRPKLDEEVLHEIVEEGVAGASEWEEWKRLGRMAGNWYEGYVDKLGTDGRLRTSFRQWPDPENRRGVVSGRVSVERVNLQAIPQDWKLQGGLPSVRSFFVAREGYELWEMDQSQAEVRVAARLTGDAGLLEVVQSGGDIHGTITKMVFEVEENDPKWDELRSICKRVTFCIIYGGAGGALQHTLKAQADLVVPREQCDAWVNMYRSTYPGIQREAKRLERLAWDIGYTRLVSGRKRWWRPGEERHKAFNAAVQGGSAEVVQDWLLAVERAFPGMLLMTIHDSLIMEIPAAQAAGVVGDVCQLGARIGEGLFDLPFKVDAKRFGKKELVTV